MKENPSDGGMSLTAGLILGAAALGALFFFTRSSKAATATTPTPTGNRLPPSKCVPATAEDLEAFGKYSGYSVFYDDKSVELTQPPANPNYVNNPLAREYLVNSCSFFEWTGTQWVVDAKTNFEFDSWLKAKEAARRRGPIYAPGGFLVLR